MRDHFSAEVVAFPIHRVHRGVKVLVDACAPYEHDEALQRLHDELDYLTEQRIRRGIPPTIAAAQSAAIEEVVRGRIRAIHMGYEGGGAL